MDERQILENQKALKKRRDEYEEKYADYIKGFYIIACKTLLPYPDKYKIFQKHWNNKDYWLAYMPYMEIEHKDNIILTDEEKKIATEFYWLFVN